jgi:hypothetical protein
MFVRDPVQDSTDAAMLMPRAVQQGESNKKATDRLVYDPKAIMSSEFNGENGILSSRSRAAGKDYSTPEINNGIAAGARFGANQYGEAFGMVAPAPAATRRGVGGSGIGGRNATYKRMATEEVVEEGSLTIKGARTAGVTRTPRHHIFPLADRSWFAERGINIDHYTLELDEGTHTALHYGAGPVKREGWWNDTIMRSLRAREEALGRKLTPREILQIGAEMRRRANLSNMKVLPYTD